MWTVFKVFTEFVTTKTLLLILPTKATTTRVYKPHMVKLIRAQELMFIRVQNMAMYIWDIKSLRT